MAIIEYREFFIRDIQKNTGGYPDKEVGFPTKETVVDQNGNSTQEFNRFLKKHFPSEAVFQKFFESVTFKLNDEDTGTTDQQGLVRIAIGSNVVSRIDAETINENGVNKNYTTVVVPSTLPIVSAGSNISVTPIIRRVSDNVAVASIPVGDRQLYYVDYQIAVTGTLGSDNIKETDFVFERLMSTAPILRTNTLDAFTKLFPANIIGTNDYIEYNFESDERDSNKHILGTLRLVIGNDSDANNRIDLSLPNASTFGQNGGLTRKCTLKIYRTADNGFIVYFEAMNYAANRTQTPFPSYGATEVQVDGNIVNANSQTATSSGRSYYRRKIDVATDVDWTQPIYISIGVSLDGELQSFYNTRRITTHCKAVVN